MFLIRFLAFIHFNIYENKWPAVYIYTVFKSTIAIKTDLGVTAYQYERKEEEVRWYGEDGGGDRDLFEPK